MPTIPAWPECWVKYNSQNSRHEQSTGESVLVNRWSLLPATTSRGPHSSLQASLLMPFEVSMHQPVPCSRILQASELWTSLVLMTECSCTIRKSCNSGVYCMHGPFSLNLQACRQMCESDLQDFKRPEAKEMKEASTWGSMISIVDKDAVTRSRPEGLAACANQCGVILRAPATSSYTSVESEQQLITLNCVE